MGLYLISSPWLTIQLCGLFMILRNFRRISAEFAGVSRFRFSFATVLTFTSSVLKLLTFLLPIKVVILLGGEGIPAIFRGLQLGISKADLVQILVGAIFVSYSFSLAIDAYVNKEKIKLSNAFLFENKKNNWGSHKLVGETYTKLLLTSSNSILSVLIIAVIALIYLNYLFFLLLSIAVTLILLGAFFLHKSRDRNSQPLKPGNYINKVYAPVFLLSFCYVVVDFYNAGFRPSILSAIISLILTRQFLGLILQNIKCFLWVEDNLIELNSLFYKGYTIPKSGRYKNFWEMVDQGFLEEFIRNVLGRLGYSSDVDITYRYLECGIGFLNILKVNLLNEKSHLIFKVYDRNKKRLSYKEKLVLPFLQRAGLVPDLISSFEHDLFPVHVFSVSGEFDLSPNAKPLGSIINRMAEIRFDSEFITEYISSHPLFFNRISDQFVSRIGLSLNSSDMHYLESFRNMREPLFSVLKQLPITLAIPKNIIKELIFVDSEASYILGIGDWSLEVLGYGPWDYEYITIQSSIYGEREVPVDPAFLVDICSALWSLEKHCNSGSLTEAFSCIKDIVTRVKDAESEIFHQVA